MRENDNLYKYCVKVWGVTDRPRVEDGEQVDNVDAHAGDDVDAMYENMYVEHSYANEEALEKNNEQDEEVEQND